MKSTDAKIKLAVLPFVNMSADKDNEYFSDGITEEILNALTKVEHLLVTARTSSFMFKGKNIDVRTIGSQLNVDVLLEGSVRKSGNKVRITAQLVDVADGYHFWSENYDRNLDDIFAVQDEISLMIAEKIRENVGHLFIEEHLIKHPTHNLEAYNLYLKAKYHNNNWTPEELEKAIELFNKAINLQPDFALPYIGLARAYTFLTMLGMVQAEETYTTILSYLNRALELDNNLSEAYALLGQFNFSMEWNFEKAYINLDKALRLNPNNAEAYQILATVFLADLKLDESWKAITKAVELDPLSVNCLLHLSSYYYQTSDYENAMKIVDKVLIINPYFVIANAYKAKGMALLGKYEEALQLVENIMGSGNGSGVEAGTLGFIYALKGDKEKAEEYVNILAEQLESDKLIKAGGELIEILTILGRYDEALDIIEEGVEYKAPGLIYIKINTHYKPLRKFERFKIIAEAIVGGNYKLPDAKTEKYAKSKLKDSELKKYKKQLLDHIVSEKPYLDNRLTLNELASNIGISGNQMSQVLNEGVGQNFYEFINSYRLDSFREKMKNPESKRLTLLSIAYECGFNSKTTFNTYVKKTTGKTPSELFC